MGRNLTGQTISSTYEGMVQISGSILTDGTGSNINNLTVTASRATSASFATTASYAENAAGVPDALFTASVSNATVTFTKGDASTFGITVNNVVNANSASLATTASYALTTAPINTIFETVRAGENLVKTDPVYLSGSVGANPIAFKADAANAAKMPVTYVMDEAVTAGSTGRAIALGLISGIDLTGFTAGQEVYVAAGGGWTATRPTGSAIVQLLGVVTKGGNGGLKGITELFENGVN